MAEEKQEETSEFSRKQILPGITLENYLAMSQRDIMDYTYIGVHVSGTKRLDFCIFKGNEHVFSTDAYDSIIEQFVRQVQSKAPEAEAVIGYTNNISVSATLVNPGQQLPNVWVAYAASGTALIPKTKEE